MWSFFVSTTTADQRHQTADPPPDPLLTDRWLSAEEAGQYLGYSAWTIRNYAKRRLLTCTKAPGQSGGYRFKRQWLDEFIESRSIPAKTTDAMLAYRAAEQAKTNARMHAAASRPRLEELDPDLAKRVARERAKMAAKAAREGGRSENVKSN